LITLNQKGYPHEKQAHYPFTRTSGNLQSVLQTVFELVAFCQIYFRSFDLGIWFRSPSLHSCKKEKAL